MKRIIIGILIGLLVGICCSSLYMHFRPTTPSSTKTITYKTIIRDTVEIEKPVPVHHYFRDTILIKASPDTIIKDSIVFLQMPSEVKEYRREEYYAKVSGIAPNLDSIAIFREKEIIDNIVIEKKRPRVSLGVGLGWALTPDLQVKPTVNVSVYVPLINYY